MYNFYTDSHLDGVKFKSMFYNKDLVYTDFKKRDYYSVFIATIE